MNLFNCFQAVGFYSLLPLLVKWLNDNGHTGFFYIGCAVWLAGYILISLAVEKSLD